MGLQLVPKLVTSNDLER